MEDVVAFKNDRGKTLFGILHSPEVCDFNKINLVILLNSGLVDRVGPHRLYVKTARRLCSDGYFVFRFDSHGLGHSEGELSAGVNVLNFVKIENGLFVNDVLSAVKYLLEKIVPDKISLVGLCGGAVTAILAAELNKQVNCVVLISPPVYVDCMDLPLGSNPLEARITLTRSVKKMFKIKYWIKFFSFKINIFDVFKMIIVFLKAKFVFNTNKNREKTSQYYGRPLNMKFVNAFYSLMMSKRHVLFVLGNLDFTATEFNYKFRDRYLNKKYQKLYDVVNIEGANHEFHSLSAQAALIDKISKWLYNQSLN